MSVEEDLKLRFVALALRRDLRETPEGELEMVPLSEQVPLWDMVAQECVRQMEWARRECSEGIHFMMEGDTEPALTLAPEDWRPDPESNP